MKITRWLGSERIAWERLTCSLDHRLTITEQAGGGVQYHISSPNVNCVWPADQARSVPGRATLRATVNVAPFRVARLLMSESRRNRQLELPGLTRHSVCGSTQLTKEDAAILCAGCNRHHPIQQGGITDFTSAA